MPSPNGFFDCGASSNISRNWFRAQLTHDATSPPWPPVNAAAYEFEINIGTAAAGPFTPADLTGPGSDCSAPNPTNRTGFSTAAQTLFGVAGLDADTDYWLEVILHDENDVEVDRFVCGPTHTAAYPTFACAGGATGETTADVTLGSTTGRVNTTAPCNQDSIVWEIATTPGGPYTAAPSEPVSSLSPSHSFTGLTAGTTYYWRARLSEMQQSGGEYLVTQECSFTTEEAPVTTPPFDPQPCAGGGAGADAVDVEQIVLCDLDAEGNLLGTALAVYEYDTDGNPTGAPTFVDPATGDPYVPQGTLQPCPDAACLPPMQFCQTSTTTGPVEHPGRQYDLTLPINPGFAVQSLQVDAVSHAAGITWEVDDPDGETFRQNLTTFIEGRVPAAATVTITNPNAGVPQVCGAAQPMTVHIECLRLDQAPPDLIELVYNGGQDLIQNPAYNEFPALNPPVSQGNYGFRLLSRQDDPGPFPGNQPANDALCTSVANRGWETNDVGRTFEIWGQDIVNGSNVTPTPRGTPVQEMTSDGPPPGGLSTIWQTFQAPASGNFIIRVIHGARDPGETHRITLDNGDTDDAQNGDLIDDTTNPPSVTSNGGPNPWTQFSQTIPLNAGSTYTLALSSTNPVAGARGGLFTDMRAYIDRPDQRATAATDDDTCVVTTEETTTNTVCSFWQPQCAGGVVVGWQKVDTGESLSNAEFWAQVPTPGCCLPDTGGEGEGSSTLSNMMTSDIVCATVGGVPQNAIRVMVTDPSGGTLQTLFLGTDGAPIAPDTWTPGACTTSRYMADQVLCDDSGPFLRKYVQSLDATNQAQVNSFRDFTLTGTGYTVVGEVRQCGGADTEIIQLCDSVSTGPDIGQTTSTPFLRHFSTVGGVTTFTDTTLDGTTPYVPAGFVFDCYFADVEAHVVCDFGTLDGDGNPHQYIQEWIYNRATGQPFTLSSRNFDGTAHAAIGPVRTCPEEVPDRDREVVCWTQNSTGDQIHTGTIRHDDSLPAPGWILFDQHQTPVSPTEPGLTFVPCDTACTSCQTLTLCDFGADEPALITGISTGGTLSNGVTWSGARGSSALFNPQHDNADGSWWGMPGFPNATVAPDTWFFDRPVDVEFSVVIAYSPATGSGAINQVQVPIGSELISSAPDYSYDVATGIVTVDASNTGDCTKVTNPTVANSARFVLRNVSQFTLDFLGQRIAICGQFSNWRFGSIAVTPATSTFLRTICRDCDGVVTTFTDTTLDGTTPYVPVGPVGECGTAADEPQCYATQICVQPQGVQEFISNEANLTSTVAVPNVDPVWKWSNDPVAGPWFDMYDVGVFPGWTTVDPGTTEGVANWVAPHPNSSPNTSGLAGEGPTIGPGNAEWYARAQFTLPANANPASIRIAATVINADQLGVEFRLNGGAWQPVNASHTAPPFNFPAQVIPGAQAGLNEVFVHVRETVFGSGAAGVKMHLIASYDLGDQQSWTQIVCDDGTVSYFTNAGEQTDALPEDWVIVPCGSASSDAGVTDQQDVETLILCDATPTRFLRAIKYDAETGAVLTVVNTTLDGTTPFAPVGAVGICTTPVATDFDFDQVVLCDSNGTAFIRRFTFNSSTGAVTTTTNLTLAGAAFVPVGAVGQCSDCCPQVVGSGCISTGSGFYTAIRAANGTISLIDSVTGAAVLAANIIPCPSDNTTRTLTAQGRVLTNAAPWTPAGDVAGTLTSLTVTGVSGLWDLVDANGTALTGLPAGLTLTWSAEDDNTLTGPQSVTPQAGASVVANWTQR